VDFEIEGKITEVETFDTGRAIRKLPRFNKYYGKRWWRKRKGNAKVRLKNGEIRLAELHWYEATGIGKKEFKIKRYLDW